MRTKRKKNQLNVFQKSPYKWYCFWSRIKFHKNDLKFAWQRITRGYSDKDIWDLDHYYSQLFVDTLTTFKENLHGAPDDLFNHDTDDEIEQVRPWVEYLEDMIDHFYSSIEENKVYENPYEEEYFKIFDRVNWKNFSTWSKTEEEKELYNRYCDKNIENLWRRRVHRKKAFEMLQERFEDLWD